MSKRFFTTLWQSWQEQHKQVALTVRTQDEYEFQPGYLEIIERSPSPWARRSAFSLVALIVCALVWSVIGHLEIYARASGRLLVSSHSKMIQSVEAGEITAIKVKNGQQVKQGQVLFTLNPVGIDAQIKELKEQQRYRELEQARLQALQSPQPLQALSLSEKFTEQERQSTALYLRSEWDQLKQKLANFERELEANKASQSAIEAEIAALANLIANVETRITASRILVKKDQFPRMELLIQEQEALQLQLNLARKQEDLNVLEAQNNILIQKRDSFLADQRLNYFVKLAEVEESLAVISQQLIQQQERRRLHTIVAPVDGVVQQLAIHTLGGAIQAAQQLMVLVPDNAPLEAEVMVLNKDVGFVHPGQSVEIKIDSFPYTRYGTISGTVSHLSKDAVEDEQLGLVFPTKIVLLGHHILVGEQQVPLQAGMTINTEIRTGERRVIDYLLSPLQQYQSEALRER